MIPPEEKEAVENAVKVISEFITNYLPEGWSVRLDLDSDGCAAELYENTTPPPVFLRA